MPQLKFLYLLLYLAACHEALELDHEMEDELELSELELKLDELDELLKLDELELELELELIEELDEEELDEEDKGSASKV